MTVSLTLPSGRDGQKRHYGRDATHHWMLSTGGLCILVAVFFSGYHILRPGEQNFTLADIFTVAAFGLFFLLGRLNMRPFAELTPAWMISLMLIFGGLFLGSLINGDIIRWLIVTLQYSMGWFFIPILFTSVPKRFVRIMVATFLLGITTMEIVGITATFLIDHATAKEIFSNEFIAGNGRLGSFAGEPNWNGQLIAYSFVTLIYCWQKRILPVWAMLAIAPILGWALLLCASVTGFAASVLATMIALAMLNWRYLIIFFFILILGGSAILGGVISSPEIFEKRVGTAIITGDISNAGTFTGRTALIAEAWDMADDTIFIGVGVDQFRTISPTRQPVHNLYLLFWTEGGLIALAGLITLLATMAILALRKRFEYPAEAAFAVPLVLVYSIYAMSSPHMFVRFGILPVMLALATIYGRPDPVTRNR